MCGFSAKGPWVVVVDGVPYGAYTEGQADKVADAAMTLNPNACVSAFKMQKFVEGGPEYPDSVLEKLGLQITHEMYQEAVVVDELAGFDMQYSGGGKLADLIVTAWEKVRPRKGADSPAGHGT